MGTLPLSFEQESPPSFKLFIKAETMAPFPEIKSKHSLVAKHVTEDKWNKLNEIVSKTSQFTLAKAIACAVEFDNQHCGIYAGDEDSYVDFAEVFDPLICEYHGLAADFKHTSDMDSSKMEGDLSGTYYPLAGMDEKVRQQLVDDHFLFMSGDPNLKVAGMERDWPEGRGIFHNADKTFLVWVNEEDQLRIISMQKGGDVRGVFERLARGIKVVQDSVKAES